jgi:succinate-acetate transporter protein
MAVFCGGLAQLLAGMWEFPRGNTFGATGTVLQVLTCFTLLLTLVLKIFLFDVSFHIVRSVLDVLRDHLDPRIRHRRGVH